MYQISLPHKIYAGFDSLPSIRQVIDETAAKQVLVLTDASIQKSGLLDLLTGCLPDRCQVRVEAGLVPEPSYYDVSSALTKLDNFSPDLIIGFGGGSVMDAAKLFSILIGAAYSIKDLLQDATVGVKKVRTVMIPTTCGTGSEVTFNAIVSIPEEMVKKGIVNPQMTPDYVIIEPLAVQKLPASILAATGVDAFCHGIECFTSNKANAISDVFALACTTGILKSICQAYNDPQDLQARLDLQMAALYGGLAISSSGTTAVHALSYPLGGKFHIPHGVSNAVLLLPVMKFNADACADRLGMVCDAVHPALHSAPLDSKVDYVLAQIQDMITRLNLPAGLDTFGIGLTDLDFLVDAAFEQRRLLNNNRKPVEKADIRAIYSTLINSPGR